MYAYSRKTFKAEPLSKLGLDPSIPSNADLKAFNQKQFGLSLKHNRSLIAANQRETFCDPNVPLEKHLEKIGHLGEGGWAPSVDLYQLPNGKKMAIKKFIPQPDDAEFVEELQERVYLQISSDVKPELCLQKMAENEFQIQTSLNNACVTKSYHLVAKQEAGLARYYLVMEYVDGKTLEELWPHLLNLHENFKLGIKIAPQQPYPNDLSKQLIDSLIYLIDQDVSINDFDPSNMMLTSTEKLKLIDFDTCSFSRLISSGEFRFKDAFGDKIDMLQELVPSIKGLDEIRTQPFYKQPLTKESLRYMRAFLVNLQKQFN